MTDENKKRLREEVEIGGWTIIWAGAVMPCALLDEPCELLYEDMDGYVCQCDAIYTVDRSPYSYKPYFRGTSGAVKDAKMCNCIAWRKQHDSRN